MPESYEDQAREHLRALAEHTQDLLREADDDDPDRALAAAALGAAGAAVAAITVAVLGVAQAVRDGTDNIVEGR